MIELASTINESMPEYVVERVAHLLNKKQVPLKKAPVLVLGVSYKKDIDDLRESPALEVIKHLTEKGSRVSYSDPWIPSVQIGKFHFRSQRLTPRLLKKQACVVMVTDHAAFDAQMIVGNAKLVLDTRNGLRRFAPRGNLFFL